MTTPDGAPDSRSERIEAPAQKSRGGLARIAPALGYSLRGLRVAIQREAAFRQELLLALILTPTALLLPVSTLERLALISPLFLTLIVELLNSAIEAAVDRISIEQHPLAAQAKDLGSAAVFCCLILTTIAWSLIAGPVIIGLILAS